MNYWGVFALITVCIASYISKAPPLITVGSIIGIIYVVGVAMQHKAANLAGALCAVSFGLASYQAGFYANAFTNLIILAPLSLAGFWVWRNNSVSDQTRVRSLSSRGRRSFVVLLSMAICIGLFINHGIGSTSWVLDTVTAITPIGATILLISRYKEHWYLWVPYNGLEVLLWFSAVSAAPEMLAILVMRIVFLINSIYGFYLWQKST